MPRDTKSNSQIVRMKKAVFIKRVSRSGEKKQLVIYIPAVVAPLIKYQGRYKITLEEV